jgi:hypothetical protein
MGVGGQTKHGLMAESPYGSSPIANGTNARREIQNDVFIFSGQILTSQKYVAIKNLCDCEVAVTKNKGTPVFQARLKELFVSTIAFQSRLF